MSRARVVIVDDEPPARARMRTALARMTDVPSPLPPATATRMLSRAQRFRLNSLRSVSGAILNCVVPSLKAWARKSRSS